jgi:hypothetical protein
MTNAEKLSVKPHRTNLYCKSSDQSGQNGRLIDVAQRIEQEKMASARIGGLCFLYAAIQ